MKLKLALVAGLLAAISTTAIAGDNYFSGGVGFGKFKVNSYSSSQTTLDLTYGHMFNDYFGLEAKANFGINGGDGFDTDLIYGGYLKGNYPFSNKFDMYVVAGYAETKLSDEGDSDSDGSFSYGIGANYQVNKAWSVGLNYISYYSDSDEDIGIDYDTLGLNATYKF